MGPENRHQNKVQTTVCADTGDQAQGELTAQLFAQLPRSVLATLLLAGLTLLVVSEDAIGSRLNWWCGSVAVVSAVRLYLAWQYRRKARPGEKYWLRAFTLLALASGVVWSGLLLTHDAAAHSPSTIYTAVALIGMCAGAITTMAHYPKAYIAFITPPLIGFTTWALLGMQPAQPALALATIAAFGLLVAAGYRFQSALKQTLELGFERERLSRRLESDHAELRRAQEILLHEQEVAAYVMDSIVEPHACSECGLRVHTQPLHRFDGDVLIKGVSGGRCLRVLLGDATGHGLSAAIAAIPAVQTFRAINRRSLDCETLITELNSNMYRLLPRNIFLAAALIELKPRHDGGCDALIWNGGLDDLLLVTADGQLRRIKSRNLSLGILEPHAFEPHFERITLAAMDRLYAYSDGLTEGENAGGEGFGRKRLEATLLAAPVPSSRLDHVLAQHRAFFAGAALSDDLTLIEIQPDAVTRRLQRQPQTPQALKAPCPPLATSPG